MRQGLGGVERCHPCQPSARVEIPHRGQRRNLIGSPDHCGTETKTVLDGNTKPRHQRPRVPTETLLPRNQGIAMVGIFHLALLHVGGSAHVMGRPNDPACPFAREKLPNRLDFLPGSFLLGDHMVEAKHHWSRPNTMRVSVSPRIRSSS